MLRLSLFGGFTLLGADGAAVVIASRKCRALLAYLALQPRPTPRERLAGLLWGDGGEARARGSLRQALTTLRRRSPATAPGWTPRADSVAVDHQALWVDAAAAQAAAAGGRRRRRRWSCAAGASCWRGSNPGAAEFDDWRDGERRRWRERETAALRRWPSRPGRRATSGSCWRWAGAC